MHGHQHSRGVAERVAMRSAALALALTLGAGTTLLADGEACAFADVCCGGICAPNATGTLVCATSP